MEMEKEKEMEMKKKKEEQKKELRKSFKIALMKDNVDYIMDHYKDNLIEPFKLLQYTIMENLQDVFKFYLEIYKPIKKNEIN
jgi:hypothetical protein